MTNQPILDEKSALPRGAPVLVSGASFAGLATAYWMNRLGYRVTMIEVAGGLRKGGTPVDIEGETIGILARMGMVDAVRAKALPPRGLEFKDAGDCTIGVLGNHSVTDGAPDEKYEIHRDDLLEILFASVEDSVEIVFGRSIKQLENGPDEAVVTFNDGSRRAYALVFGCDGNRSNTRRLAFGGTEDFSYFMGGYFFIKVVPTTELLPANLSQIFSVPGRTALLNGYDINPTLPSPSVLSVRSTMTIAIGRNSAVWSTTTSTGLAGKCPPCSTIWTRTMTSISTS